MFLVFHVYVLRRFFPYITGSAFNFPRMKHQKSMKTQYSVTIIWDKVLLNARYREICFRYVLRSSPSVSLQKQYFIFLIDLNGQKHVSQPLYLKLHLMYSQLRSQSALSSKTEVCLKTRLLLYTCFYNISFKDAQRKKIPQDNRKPFKIHSRTGRVTHNLSKWVISVTEMHCSI